MLGKVVSAAAIFLLCCSPIVLAAGDEPPPNPLEITAPDPLLPQWPLKQPLSPQERSELKAALDKLNSQATAQFQAGNKAAAFEIWHRELRLRRALGPLEEVEALGRVGGIAWQDNQKAELPLITGRLQAIQQQAQRQPPVEQALWRSLGEAYQQVRVPELALRVYQQILAWAREQQDTATEIATLKTIGSLQLAWFDYAQAAATYELLLTMAQQQGDSVNEIAYWQQLAYIYDQGKQPQNSLKSLQQLEQTYLKQKDFDKLTPLKIAIASAYEALGQFNEASVTYQQAYQLAMSRQQFDYASVALQKLAALYKSHNQPETALHIYQVLLEVDRQAFNFYGLMDTYDHIGQIYLEHKKYPQALEAFQQGLELAKSLDYQESYFTTQIEQINQPKAAKP